MIPPWHHWSRREKLLAGAVVIAMVVAVLDGIWRPLAAKQRHLEARIQELASQPLPAVSRPAGPSRPVMPLLRHPPPGLRLTSLNKTSPNASGEVITQTMTGAFSPFMDFMISLEQTEEPWRWVEVEYRVKEYPLAEIRLVLAKP